MPLVCRAMHKHNGVHAYAAADYKGRLGGELVSVPRPVLSHFWGRKGTSNGY